MHLELLLLGGYTARGISPFFIKCLFWRTDGFNSKDRMELYYSSSFVNQPTGTSSCGFLNTTWNQSFHILIMKPFNYVRKKFYSFTGCYLTPEWASLCYPLVTCFLSIRSSIGCAAWLLTSSELGMRWLWIRREAALFQAKVGPSFLSICFRFWEEESGQRKDLLMA